MSKGFRRQGGFTLVELVIFIVIVSVGIAGILLVMNTVVASSADPMVRKQALALADSILEEILQKDYADPDGTSGETTRTTFDDVDDYNGKTNSTFTDLPASLASYLITIVVDAPAPLNGVTVKRVRVTVSRGAESITLTGYRGNY
ncbi:prepilin-type N-terminal cleavage/methylation domain-containing protein [Curvibacter delicatus]|uniref:prepilin-type N-terminal cleavage/methylation domain-containing protein n=1 Tax=Curvibacter delicatus TaxID=80879 RepID=UPI001470DA10|nr:prepilin-type N-terminal cleavage/methylation domain-containing protein [Curvibacter delicatus]